MVNPAPERQVRTLAATDIQPVRILEHIRIPVGCPDKQHDVVAFSYRKAVYLAIRQHPPKIGLHWRNEAQQLLDCRREQARISSSIARTRPLTISWPGAVRRSSMTGRK